MIFQKLKEKIKEWDYKLMKDDNSNKDNIFWILIWLIFFTYLATDSYIGYLDKKAKVEYEIKIKELEIQSNSQIRDYTLDLKGK